MRTTLNIDDDLMAAVKSLAHTKGKPLGTIISELIRKGLAPTAASKSPDGFPVFQVSASSGIVTPDQIKEALDEDW